VVEDAGQWKVTVPRHVVASWVLQNLAFYPFSYSHVGVMLEAFSAAIYIFYLFLFLITTMVIVYHHQLERFPFSILGMGKTKSFRDQQNTAKHNSGKKKVDIDTHRAYSGYHTYYC
jgi:hypothetical protein